MIQLKHLVLGLRLGLFALIIGSGLYALYLLDFNVPALFERTQEVEGWMFVLAMSLLPVAGFPIAAFYLFAGIAFGFWEAWVYCVIALAMNMSLSYVVARHLLHGPLTALLNSRGYSMPKLSEINQFRFVFLIRTVPGPPYPFQNYLLSLMGIPFGLYLGLSLLTQGTIAAGMVACGGLLPDELTLQHLWIALGIVGVLIVGKALYWWRARRRAASDAAVG